MYLQASFNSNFRVLARYVQGILLGMYPDVGQDICARAVVQLLLQVVVLLGSVADTQSMMRAQKKRASTKSKTAP